MATAIDDEKALTNEGIDWSRGMSGDVGDKNTASVMGSRLQPDPEENVVPRDYALLNSLCEMVIGALPSDIQVLRLWLRGGAIAPLPQHILGPDLPTEIRVRLEQPLDSAISGWVEKNYRPLIIAAKEAGFPDFTRLLRECGIEYFCAAPLTIANRLIGIVGLASSRRDAFGIFDRIDPNGNENTASAGDCNGKARSEPEMRDHPDAGSCEFNDELSPDGNFEGIIGRSAVMRLSREEIRVVAPTDSTVLILGETGTGKELIANAIHNLSARREHPFIKVNCAAIPSGLLESELFGHERGAFTGAVGRRIGRFEMANNGTLFLDEIGDIPLELQPKLLRVLQEQEFERIGGTQTTKVNVRIVAATSRDLSQMVADRAFRADLYYRLNVFPLNVPALRERSEDIPLLVRYLVDLYARRMDKPVKDVPLEIMQAFFRYSWPGNVRELQNVIERAVILSPGKVLQLPITQLTRSPQTVAVTEKSEEPTLKDLEREHIIRALATSKWVLGGPNGAAVKLGLARTTLIGKLNRLGISRGPC